MYITMLTSRCRAYPPSSLSRRRRRTLRSLQVSLYPQASPSKSAMALRPTAPSRSQQPSLTIPRVSSQPASTDSTLPWLPSQPAFILPWLPSQLTSTLPCLPNQLTSTLPLLPSQLTSLQCPTCRRLSPPIFSQGWRWHQAPRPGSEVGLENTLTLVREVTLLLIWLLILSRKTFLAAAIYERIERTRKSATSPVPELPAGARALHPAPARVPPRGLRPHLHQAEPPGGPPPQPRRGQALRLLPARL